MGILLNTMRNVCYTQLLCLMSPLAVPEEKSPEINHFVMIRAETLLIGRDTNTFECQKTSGNCNVC